MVNPELDCIFHLFVNDLSTPGFLCESLANALGTGPGAVFPVSSSRLSIKKIAKLAGKLSSQALRSGHMVKKQRFRHAIEKRFRRHFGRYRIDSYFHPADGVFPGIKLALPLATVFDAKKCAPGDVRRPHPTSAQSLPRFAYKAARLNYVTRSTTDDAQPFNEQGNSKNCGAQFRRFCISKSWLRKRQLFSTTGKSFSSTLKQKQHNDFRKKGIE
jgi:hypothetical protein